MALNIQAVVSLDTQMFTAGIRGIEAQINQFAGLAIMQFGGVAQQVSAMWGAFGAAGGAISALSQITQVGAEYEQQMMRVQSYTQASADTMAHLSSEGAEMAATFGFSTKQVGESMASLALAGVEASDMAEVLQSSLLLASATLGDANQSAELITSTLKVFQQEMSGAKETADLFAGAIASSPLDLQRLSDSMKYAGATGSAFGMSMNQVVSEIAAFHQVGLRGQLAGTAFRGALLELSAAASTAKGVVGPALQGWIPSTEGLTGAVRRLNAAGIDGSIVIQELGKRAGPGVAALMKMGSDAMVDLTGKIKSNSDVVGMHETQMQALEKQYEVFKGEVSALAIKIYNQLAPGLKEVVSQARDSLESFTNLASGLKGIVAPAFNTLLPGVVRMTATLVSLNAAIKAINFTGLNVGANSFAGIITKARSNVAAMGAEVGRLVDENVKLSTTVGELTQKKDALTMRMDSVRAQYQLGMITQEQFNKSMSKLGGQISGVNKSLEKNSSALMWQTAKLDEASAAVNGFSMGMSKAAVAVSALSAGVMGFELGTFIANVKIADRTVSEWLGNGIASMIDYRASVQAANADIPEYIKEMREYQRSIRDAGREMATTFMQNLPQSADWAERLNSVLDEMDGLAKKLKADLQNTFTFNGGDVFGEIERMKGSLAEAAREMGATFDENKIKGFTEKLTDFQKNLSAMQSEIQGKQDQYFQSKQREETIAQTINAAKERQKELEAEINAESQKYLGPQRIEHINKLKAEYKALGEEINTLGGQANTAATESSRLENEIGVLTDRARKATGEFQGLSDEYGELSSEIDDARRSQEEWNAALAQQQANELARQLDNLADAYRKTNLSMADTKAGVEALGSRFGEYVKAAEDAGIKTEQVGKNLQWLNQNQERARRILEALGIDVEEITLFMVKYGDKSYDVARRMSQLGETENEAATAVGVFDSAVKQNNQTLAENTNAIAANQKALTNLAAMSGARLTRLTANLKQLREALTPPANAPAIDLSWLSALGTMVKLPRLTGIDSWLEKFDSLATGVQGVANRMGGVDLSWVDALKGFSLPGLGDVSSWKKDFDKWVGAFTGNLPDIERFAAALTSLQGSLSALDDATLKIVFKDEAILSKIETHLSTLASLKGVIWA